MILLFGMRRRIYIKNRQAIYELIQLYTEPKSSKNGHLPELYIRESEHYVLYWTLDTEDEPGPEGGLQSDYQHVSFRYSEHTSIEFIQWHRALIPEQYTLYLFNSSSAPAHLILTMQTNAKQIESYLLRS